MSSQQVPGKREMPIAEAVRVSDLVNYQEGAVVSRTLVNRTTATLTLFAFDEGQALSEHTAPFDAVVHLLEGEAEIAVAGKPLRATAGEAVLMPAHQPHSLKALSRFKMLLTMIRSWATRTGPPNLYGSADRLSAWWKHFRHSHRSRRVHDSGSVVRRRHGLV